MAYCLRSVVTYERLDDSGLKVYHINIRLLLRATHVLIIFNYQYIGLREDKKYSIFLVFKLLRSLTRGGQLQEVPNIVI